MTFGTFLGWMLCGLVVGLIARLWVPGRQNMGLLMTLGLGIVGAIAGGVLYTIWQRAPSKLFAFSGEAWQGWIAASLGAAVVLWFPLVRSSKSATE